MVEISADELKEAYLISFKGSGFSKHEVEKVDYSIDLMIVSVLELRVVLSTLQFLNPEQTREFLNKVLEQNPFLNSIFQVWFAYCYKSDEKPEISNITFEDIPGIMEQFYAEIQRLKNLKKHLVDFYYRVSFLKDTYEGKEWDYANYNPIVTNNESLQNYITRGQQIFQTNDVNLQWIFDVFVQIESLRFGLNGMLADSTDPFPFVFVCCSSGTGKTQLPFCFPKEYPVFYFLFNWFGHLSNISDQSIYKNFGNLSEALRLCVERDLKNVPLANEDLTTSGLQVNVPLYTAGFIVELLKKYLDHADNENSIKFIAEQTAFDFEPILWLNAKKTIESFRTNSNDKTWTGKRIDHLPVIFIDETTVAGDASVRHFLFLRSLLRIIEVIPVFMGTNFNVSNLLSRNIYRSSRPSNIVYRLFLIYKLPPIAENVLAEEFEKIHNLNPGGRQDIDDFLSTIFEFLKKERPWFAFKIIDYLKLIFQAIHEAKDNNKFSWNGTYIDLTPKNIFENAIEKLFTNFKIFKTRKSQEMEFNFSHSCYFSAKNRTLQRDRKDNGDSDDDFPFFSDLRNIHCHISFLQPPTDCVDYEWKNAEGHENETYFRLFDIARQVKSK